MRIYRDEDGDVCVEPAIHEQPALNHTILLMFRPDYGVGLELWVADTFIHIRRIV